MFDSVYLDPAEKLKAHIRSLDGVNRLPGVRVLGRQFGANPATVLKALRLLREKGLVSIVRGQGVRAQEGAGAQAQDDPCVLARLPFDGFFFIFSSLTYEFAAVLKAERIPFVAANASFGIPEVNYADFNETRAISDCISIRQRHGFRRFGYFGVFGPCGHSEKCRIVFRSKQGSDYRRNFFVNDCFENPLLRRQGSGH